MKTILFLALLVTICSAARLRGARQEAASPGYNYPKPAEQPSSGYNYPKPEQEFPEEPTTPSEAEETTTEADNVEAVAEAEAISNAQADQLRVRIVPEKLIASIQQPVQFQRIIQYYPNEAFLSARLQAEPVVQYTVAPSGFSYSTQVFQRW